MNLTIPFHNYNCNCNKTSSKAILCGECSNKFCSDSCITNHIKDNHQNIYNIENTNINFNYESNEKIKKESCFIKHGVCLSNFKEDPYYKYSNFEMQKSQVLGSGAIGEVILAYHKGDKKKYAIKKVYKHI